MYLLAMNVRQTSNSFKWMLSVLEFEVLSKSNGAKYIFCIIVMPKGNLGSCLFITDSKYSLAQGNVFTHVCLPRGSASQGVCLPGGPCLGGLPPGGVCLQWSLPTGRLGRPRPTRKVGGTHPTGKFSCIIINVFI